MIKKKKGLAILNLKRNLMKALAIAYLNKK